jgi:hypothetical protein
MKEKITLYFINRQSVEEWTQKFSYKVKNLKKPCEFGYYDSYREYINGSTVAQSDISFYVYVVDPGIPIGTTFMKMHDSVKITLNDCIEPLKIRWREWQGQKRRKRILSPGAGWQEQQEQEIQRRQEQEIQTIPIWRILPSLMDAVNSFNEVPFLGITTKWKRGIRYIHPEKSAIENKIEEGDVLIFEYKTISNVVDAAMSSFIRKERLQEAAPTESAQYSIYLRPSDSDGISFLDYVTSKEINLISNDRPMLILLYTDEDVNVATYVRTHCDALDRASGKFCDVYCIENPDVVSPPGYWREKLATKTYLLWNLLRWTDTVPYDKNQAYQIANQLDIPLTELPCAVELTKKRKRQIWRLNGDLTRCFRNIFTHYQYQQTVFPKEDLYDRILYSRQMPEQRIEKLRKFVYAMLKTDSDLEAFCTDYFPEIYRRFSVTMEGTHKVTLLLRYSDPDYLIDALARSNPEKYLMHKYMLHTDES